MKPNNQNVIVGILFLIIFACFFVSLSLMNSDGDSQAKNESDATASAGHNILPKNTTPEKSLPDSSSELSTNDFCDFTVDTFVETVDGLDNFRSVSPGDRICILAGQRKRLEIQNIQGEPGNPIILINYGGVVNIDDSDGHALIHFINSRYVILSGTGVAAQCGADYSAAEQQCGFRLANGARGITGNQGTNYIQIDHIEIGHIRRTGINIKSSLPRGAFNQNDTIIENTYIHDVGSEGLYIGSSKYELGEDPLLYGVWISGNLLENTGWDGIQVGSAVSDCFIFNNRIVEAGQANKDNQRSGIINNKGSVCDIYSNMMVDTGSKGIYVQGNGNNKIYNNLIVRPGTLDQDGGGHGIVVTASNGTGNSIYVWNNTIIEPTDKGIIFDNDQGLDNQIINNLIVGQAETSPNDALSHIDISSTTLVEVQNNLLTNDILSVGFVDPINDDFSLAQGSLAIDTGLDLSHAGIQTDILGVSRNQGEAMDIGCYEYISD